MSALTRLPNTFDFLNTSGFAFFVKKLPATNFFIQKVRLPGMILPPVETPTPFVALPEPGDHITYEELSIDFKVDENLQNWIELYIWLRRMGFSESYEEYAALAEVPLSQNEGVKSDVSLILLDAKKRPLIEFTYRDAFPIQLSGFEVQTTNNDAEYVTATARFRYSVVNIQRIKASASGYGPVDR